MKKIQIITFFLFLFIPAISQKVDVQVIKMGDSGNAEWQILDNNYTQIFPGSTEFPGDSVSFTLEAGKIYYFQVSVNEIFNRATDLYTLKLNGEPLLLIKSDIEPGDHSFPFFTGIKYTPDKIVGGSDASISDYPWQILYISGDFMCGGTIIDKEWIVTAAHCTEESNGSQIPIDKMYIVAGATNPFTGREGQSYRISQVIVHENFNRQALTNDIALLKLQDPINIASAGPIRLLTEGDADEGAILPGVMSWVTGWGLTNVSPNQFPDNLQRVQLPIVSNEQASTVWGSIPTNVIMAGYLNGNKDACNGDSGGPLVVSVSGENKLAGIVSWGSQNCDTYSGFTKVSAFNAWIRQKTGMPAEFAPDIPTGSAIVCPGETTSHYTVSPLSGASSYQWELYPDNAGSISFTSTSADVEWNQKFFGDVTVKVRVTVSGKASEWSRLNVRLARNTRIVSQSGDKQICNGQQIKLSIVAEGDDLIFKWFRDGILLSSGSSPNLTITNSQINNSGDYRAEIEGLCGKITSAVMRVTVLPLTKINYIPSDTTVTFGDDVVLKVNAEGHNLSYVWIKDHNEVPGDSNRLFLPDVNATDIGVYQTVVTGTCGMVASNEFYVYVERSAPSLTQDIFVWPTLTNNLVNVALSTNDKYEIRIYTTTGQLLKQQRNCRFVTTIDVSNMGRGIYIINVLTDKLRRSQKIMIF